MQCNVTVDFGFKFHSVSGRSLAVGVEIRYGHLFIEWTLSWMFGWGFKLIEIISQVFQYVITDQCGQVV